MIRSVIDYSSFLINFISKVFVEKLEAIQNNTLRAIFKVKWDEMKTDDLWTKAYNEKIEDLLKKLNNRYFLSAILNYNPLISSLREITSLCESQTEWKVHQLNLSQHYSDTSFKIKPPNQISQLRTNQLPQKPLTQSRLQHRINLQSKILFNLFPFFSFFSVSVFIL